MEKQKNTTMKPLNQNKMGWIIVIVVIFVGFMLSEINH